MQSSWMVYLLYLCYLLQNKDIISKLNIDDFFESGANENEISAKQ